MGKTAEPLSGFDCSYLERQHVALVPGVAACGGGAEVEGGLDQGELAHRELERSVARCQILQRSLAEP